MTYYIFLKSLRSLKEFRKIPTSKSLINLIVQISKAFINSKILFYFQKEFPLAFGSIGPTASRPIRPFGPPGLLLPPPGPKQSAQVTAADQPRAAPMAGPDHLH
jgi:hypothetical protein